MGRLLAWASREVLESGAPTRTSHDSGAGVYARGGAEVGQRVARPGQGRRGGYRVIVAYQPGRLAVFLFGFAKNELENIKGNVLESFREIALEWSERAYRGGSLWQET